MCQNPDTKYDVMIWFCMFVSQNKYSTMMEHGDTTKHSALMPN